MLNKECTMNITHMYMSTSLHFRNISDVCTLLLYVKTKEVLTNADNCLPMVPNVITALNMRDGIQDLNRKKSGAL